MVKMKIAYVCYNDVGKYASGVENEDQVLLDFLKKKGLEITREVWNDPLVNWGEYDLAVLKSPWDYFDRISEFYTWLNKIEDLDLKLLNPSKVVKWNSDKHYLSEIAAAGLLVTPTIYFEKGEKPDLSECFVTLGTESIIVKPCISGGSKNTIRVKPENVEDLTPRIHGYLTEEAYMVQPFLPEIQSGGEWSFLFFDGNFSHSLLKKAKPGDFRVQHYLGGSIHAGPAPAHLLQAAQKYADRFAKDCLYARVDGVEVNGEFMLMELELIEPFLFLFTNPDSYENYYQALSTIIEKKQIKNASLNTSPADKM
jgi:glutathione synthase/RimK-type ligase-like ATP-grasp enzyme